MGDRPSSLVCYSIFYLLFYWIFTLEHLVTEPVYLLHCRLDDLIPFNEWFIFPYASWFGLIPWALITLLLFDRKNYFYLCGVMFSGMALCLLLYLIFQMGWICVRRASNQAILQRSLYG